MLLDSKMYEALHRCFAQILWVSSKTDRRVNCGTYLDGLARLSSEKWDHCERPITAAEIEEAMADHTRGSVPG